MAPNDVLDGTRYQIEDGQGKHLYVTIADCPEDETPLELWVTVPEENQPSQKDIRTHITTIAALFTEARQGGVPYTKLIKAMEGTCYSKSSYAAIVLNLLQRHCSVRRAEKLEFEFSSERQMAEG